MANQTCYRCGGMGGFMETQRMPNPGGGMFQEVQMHRSCSACGGVGSVWVPDPPDQVGGRISGKRASTSSVPEKDLDETVAGLIFLALWGFIGYFGIAKTGVEWYWPVGVGFAVALTVHKLLIGRYRKLLKIITRVVIVLLIGGTVLFFLIAFMR